MRNPFKIVSDVLKLLFSSKGLISLLLLSSAARQLNAQQVAGYLNPRMQRIAELANLAWMQHYRRHHKEIHTSVFYGSLSGRYATDYAGLHQQDLNEIYHLTIKDCDGLLRAYWEATDGKTQNHAKWTSRHQLIDKAKRIQPGVAILISQTYEDALNLNYIQYRYALLELVQGRKKAAANIFLDAAEQGNPDNYLYLVIAETLLNELSRFQDAENMWEKAVARQSDDVSFVGAYLTRATMNDRYTHEQTVVDNIITKMVNGKMKFDYRFLLLQLQHVFHYAELDVICSYMDQALNIFTRFAPTDPAPHLSVYIYGRMLSQYALEHYNFPKAEQEIWTSRLENSQSEITKIFNLFPKNEKLKEIAADTSDLEHTFKKRHNYISGVVSENRWLINTNSFATSQPLHQIISHDMQPKNEVLAEGEIYLPVLRESAKKTNNYKRFFAILFRLAQIHYHYGDNKQAIELLSEGWSYKAQVPLYLIGFSLHLFQSNNLPQQVTKVLEYAVLQASTDINWQQQLVEHYMQQGNGEAALKTIERARYEIKRGGKEFATHTGLLATLHLETLIFCGNIPLLLETLDDILHDPSLLLTSQQLVEIQGLVLATLEHEQYDSAYKEYAKDYRIWLQKNAGLMLDKIVADKIPTVKNLIEKPWLEPDHTVRNIGVGIAGTAAVMAFGWQTVGKSRYKKYRAGQRRLQVIRAYRAMLTFEESARAISKLPFSTAKKPKVIATTTQVISMAELLGLHEGTPLPRRPVDPLAAQEKLPASPAPTKSLPAITENRETNYRWNDENVPDYSPETKDFFIPIEGTAEHPVTVPTFFTMTPECKMEIKDAKYAIRLERKLEEQDDIGNKYLVRRTYEKESSDFQLRYKARARLKGKRDTGIFGYEKHAYNNKDEVIATVWVFDKARNHKQEDHDNFIGVGVGELIRVKAEKYVTALPQQEKQSKAAPPRSLTSRK